MKTSIDEKTDLSKFFFYFFSQNVGTCQLPHSNVKFESAISKWIQHLDIE
jgi:hypothetical protein